MSNMTPNKHQAAFAAPATEENYHQEGLTKYEYAAIQAMKGLLAGCADGEMSYQAVAEKARRYADALLEELAKSEQKSEVTGF